jgi:hypothetical protein
MALGLQEYKVSYSADNVTFTALSNVQNINLSVGIQAQLDQIRASTGQVVVRYPTGFASPITDLKAGTYIKIENDTNPSPYVLWVGKISNVVVEYGIPYSAGVGPADFLTISCEGFFADLGRMTGNNYSMAADTLTSQFSAASTQSGVPMFWNGQASRTGAAQTISGTWADWLAKTALSNNARMWDGIASALYDVFIVDPFTLTGTQNYFTDGTPDPLNISQKYDQITFDSLADNYWTQVSVAPDGLATQTVTKVGETAPFRTYQVNTNNPTTGQALDFANYLLGNYQTPKFAISSVSCLAEAQTGAMLLDNFAGFTQTFAGTVGVQTEVVFRGTTFVCVVEGVTMSATPAGARFTFYLSGADLNAYLLLDELTRGTLDNNKLGY